MAELTIPQALEAALEHHRAGRLADAEAIYRKILAVDPRQADALHLLGYLAHQCGQHDAAIDLVSRAIELQSGEGRFHHSLGNALYSRGMLEHAIAHLTRTVEICPDDFAFVNNLANVLSAAGHYPESAKQFVRVLQLAPDSAEVHNNYSIALKELGRVTEAVEHARRAVELKPEIHHAWNNYALALHANGRSDEAVAAARQALALKPDYIRAYSNLLLMLHYTSLDPAAIFAEHRTWAERFAKPLYPASGRPGAREPLDPDRLLRIGYVSGDFYEHVLSYFLRPIFALHDRSRFEIIAYSDTQRTDNATRDMMSNATAWRSIVGLSEDAVAQMIRDDDIDILVDLAGHTHGDRLLLFALRPAPIAVTYLGYPDTTGLETIDYRLTDNIADPPGMTEQWHTEKLFRLPHGAWCIPPMSNLPAASPGAPSTENGYITFGSLNALAKLSDATLDLWAQLLAGVPTSRLLIKAIGLEDADTRERLSRRLIDRGVAAERFEILGKTTFNTDHLTTYYRLDIALDTFPYHGTTTTLEALYMGVPVVTCAGKTHCSRVGASLLTNAGLSELVADCPERYVEIAAELARDADRLAAIRSGLRERVAASPVGDAAAFVRDLENAYRRMWRELIA